MVGIYIKLLRISCQTVFALAIFLIPVFVFAASGSEACSWHGGVNCSAGADWDGSVVCNDGWRSSTVLFSGMVECGQSLFCFQPIDYGCTTETDYNVLSSQQITNGTSKYAPEVAIGALSACRNQINMYQANVLSYQNCLSSTLPLVTIPPVATITCPTYSSFDPMTGACLSDSNEACTSQFGSFAVPVNDKPGYCQCIDKYIWTIDRTSCVEKAVCVNATVNVQNQCICKEGDILRGNVCISHTEDCTRDHGTYSIGSAGLSGESFCSCAEGYQWDGSKILCVEVLKSIEESNVTPSQVETSSLVDTKVTNEYDSVLANRMNGRILLQVEDAGKAWYVNDDGRRHYMKDGAAAYGMMRSFGLGITDADLSKIPVVNNSEEMKESSSVCSSNSMSERLKGKILLQVQQLGEAWYIHPDKCRRIYLKDGAAAYTIMRYLSLGITNADIGKIEIGE